jgi:hypothetical protein
MIVHEVGVVLHSEMGPGATILDAEGQGRVVYSSRLDGDTSRRIHHHGWCGAPRCRAVRRRDPCMTFGSPLIRGNIVRDNRAGVERQRHHA